MSNLKTIRKQRTVRVLIVALAAYLFYGSAGCELLDLFEGADTCRSSGSVPEVTGRWTLTGQGERSSCQNELFNGAFTLGATLDVAEASGNLSLSQPVTVNNGTFIFSGDTSGACIEFVTQETGQGGDFNFDFSGEITSAGDASGTFTGTGPPGCRSSGDWLLEVR